MPTNNRIFWAIKAVGVARLGSNSFTPIHGLQSIGITTTFNLEQVFEIGQISIYENIENIPDIEVTMEKCIDGYPLIYHLATRGYTSASLSGRSAKRCSVAMSVFNDTVDSASGTPLRQVTMSGLYFSSVTYTFPVDGNCTEAVSLVGNNKVWKSAAFDFSGSLFTNDDTPLALQSGLGGIQRREDVLFSTNVATRDANNQVAATDATILPPDIDGISSSGTNFADQDGVHAAHISSITVTTDLGRENINELGKRGPYFRYVTFPTEVKCDVETTTSTGDNVNAYEEVENLTNRSIRIKLRDGTFLNLGTKNKLASVTYGGGDTGGGNATVTYSFTNFNDLTVTHPQDPVT